MIQAFYAIGCKMTLKIYILSLRREAVDLNHKKIVSQMYTFEII